MQSSCDGRIGEELVHWSEIDESGKLWQIGITHLESNERNKYEKKKTKNLRSQGHYNFLNNIKLNDVG